VVSPLIGRDDELTRLVDLLRRHRALTLTGPAGAGKTRLAIDLAARQTEPVWYVDFSPIDDPALVAPTCATATNVALAPGDDAVRSIADTLASRHGLLVLDTCEHVLSATAQLASTVLRRLPLCGSWRPAGGRWASPANSPGRSRRSRFHRPTP
jgi:predicted ATPase